jgi:GT2 family glycosyltransferase
MTTLAAHPGAALAGPALSSDSSRIEHWCRARPTPFDLLARRFLPAGTRWIRERQFRFERRDLARDRPSDVDVLSGAFLVCDTTALRRLGGFDPRYFLYLEDYDLCRSARAAGLRCIYDPRQLVIHRRGGHSYTSIRPLLWHTRSAVQYFNKWGWLPLY